MMAINILLTTICFLLLIFMVSPRIIHKFFLLTGCLVGLGGIGYLSGNPFWGHIFIFLGMICMIALFGSYLTFIEDRVPIKTYFVDKKHIWKSLFGVLFLGVFITALVKNRDHLGALETKTFSHQAIFSIMKSEESMIPLALIMILMFIGFICMHSVLKEEK